MVSPARPVTIETEIFKGTGFNITFIEDRRATVIDVHLDGQLLGSPSSYMPGTTVDGPCVYGYYGRAGLSPGPHNVSLSVGDRTDRLSYVKQIS